MSKTTRNAPSSKALEHPLPMPVPPLSDAYKDLRVSESDPISLDTELA